MVDKEQVQFLLELGVAFIKRLVSIIQETVGRFEIVDHDFLVLSRGG